MQTSAFGVDDSRISKVSAQGSTESILEIAHHRGEHEGKSFRRCPKCNTGAFGAVQKRPPIIAAAEDTARAVGK